VNPLPDVVLILRTGRISIEEALRYNLPGAYEKIAQKIYDRVGERPKVILGTGDMGIAYGLPSGKVLKITRDLTEVQAMAAIMRGPEHPNLARIFDAFYAVNDPESRRPTGAGVIVREAIDGTLMQADGYEELRGSLRLAVYEGDSVISELSDYCSGMKRLMKALEADASNFSAFERLMLEGILSAVRAAQSLGICSIDFGPGNIGIIGTRPVLFDIGVAEVKNPRVDMI
jgi:hypothetical protein